MSGPETQPKIIVGVDGSPESMEALRWAVHQARSMGTTLEIVAAWQPSAPYAYAPSPASDDYSAGAERMLDDAVGKARAEVPDVTVHTRVVKGAPARVLTEAAGADDTLVLGSRGHGGFAGLRLGSVSDHVVHHAPCTVVVTRPQRKGD
jgi:nucleotide-binding universal stress UspA family protein